MGFSNTVDWISLIVATVGAWASSKTRNPKTLTLNPKKQHGWAFTLIPELNFFESPSFELIRCSFRGPGAWARHPGGITVSTVVALKLYCFLPQIVWKLGQVSYPGARSPFSEQPILSPSISQVVNTVLLLPKTDSICRCRSPWSPPTRWLRFSSCCCHISPPSYRLTRSEELL